MLKAIRRAEEKDIGKLIDLLHQIREYHCDFRPDIFLRGFVKYNEQELKELLKDPDMLIFVAADERDVPIGHLYCKINKIELRDQTKRKELYVDDICVDKNSRKMGVGKALMQKAKECAEKLECDNMTLNVWAGNESAEKFYSDFGLKPRFTQLEMKIK